MSLVNAIIGGNGQPEPEVGMGATICMYSDRSPVEIVEVVRFASGAKKGEIRGVRVRAMKWEIVKGSEHDGSAVYKYESNPEAPVARRMYVRDGRGRYVEAGTGGRGNRLSIGNAERYYDPHF